MKELTVVVNLEKEMSKRVNGFNSGLVDVEFHQNSIHFVSSNFSGLMELAVHIDRHISWREISRKVKSAGGKLPFRSRIEVKDHSVELGFAILGFAPQFRGIRIYEITHECQDCLEGNPTHNEYHFPHTSFQFFFNGKEKKSEVKNGSIVEEWTENEIQTELEKLEKTLQNGRLLSWTQFAIYRTNQLSS